MWFEVNGEIDVSMMLDNQHGGIDTQKFCDQLIANQAKITAYETSTEINKWKVYYKEMHPKIQLNEEFLPEGITETEVKSVFAKFLIPLAANTCRVTIIDPYIFADSTNVDLLCSILNDNVKSKKIRFVATSSKSNIIIQNEVKTRLQAEKFVVDIEDRSDIHDRWWYTRINGFTCGASFNGISRKMTMLTLIPGEDLTKVIGEFGI